MTEPDKHFWIECEDDEYIIFTRNENFKDIEKDSYFYRVAEFRYKGEYHYDVYLTKKEALAAAQLLCDYLEENYRKEQQ